MAGWIYESMAHNASSCEELISFCCLNYGARAFVLQLPVRVHFAIRFWGHETVVVLYRTYVRYCSRCLCRACPRVSGLRCIRCCVCRLIH